MFLLNLLPIFQESKTAAALSLYPRRQARNDVLSTCWDGQIILEHPHFRPAESTKKQHLFVIYTTIQLSCICRLAAWCMTIYNMIYRQDPAMPCQLSSHWWRIPRLLWRQTWYCPFSRSGYGGDLPKPERTKGVTSIAKLYCHWQI